MSVSWNEDNLTKLISLVNSNKDKTEIANIFKCSESSIYAIVRRLSITQSQHSDLLKKLNSNKIKQRATISNNRPWSEEDDATLIELRNINTPYNEISSIMNRKVSDLAHRSKKLGISKKLKEWTKEEEDTLKRLYAETGSVRCVANELHRSKEAVKQRLMLLGVYVNTTKWSESDLKTLAYLYKSQNREIPYICEIMGKTMQSVTQKLEILGLLQIQTNICSRCGEKTIVLKNGKYKGYCSECAEDLKTKEKLFKLKNEEKSENEKKIKTYIKDHYEDLIYCNNCNSFKNPNKDYYFSVINSGGCKCVWKECKECNKKRNGIKKIKNLKNKGYV